jgi:hypothetical protein
MKVKLLRPLDGQAIGSVVEYPDDDAKTLESNGVVSFIDEKAEKSAPAPLNKAEPEIQNKDVGRHRTKKGG